MTYLRVLWKSSWSEGKPGLSAVLKTRVRRVLQQLFHRSLIDHYIFSSHFLCSASCRENERPRHVKSKLIQLQKMRWCWNVEQVIVAVLMLSQYEEFK